MTALALNSGAYKSQGLIASAQRCVNLYPEGNPEDISAPIQVTHLLAPGLALAFTLPDNAPVRGIYTSSDQQLYIACGTSMYWVENVGGVYTPIPIGQITQGTLPVKFADNGTNILVADGSPYGYTILMSNHSMSGVTEAANSGINGYSYNGANWVGYLDTFLLGNVPGTNTFFASNSDGIDFDSLSFGSKTGSPDLIQVIVVLKRYIWVIGSIATEFWYTAGGTQFPFAVMPGPYLEYGAAGLYCAAQCGNAVVFLARNRQGQAVVYKGEDYSAQRVSTYALEAEFATYPDLAQCQSWSFQLGGHSFVGFRFPTTDKTWVYDINTNQWHERETEDSDGKPHQWRVNCATSAYGQIFAGDYANGNVYTIAAANLTDNGVPIRRLRSFPHQINELKRIADWKFIADMLTGEVAPNIVSGTPLLYDNPAGDGVLEADTTSPNVGQTPMSLDPNPLPSSVLPLQIAPIINLRYSDTRGASWNPYITRQLGNTGQARRIVQWRRLGIARDRVYELSWTSPQVSALNGAWMDRQPAMS